MPTYYKKTHGAFEKELEKQEHEFNKLNGTCNVIDIGEKAGFKYNRKGLKRVRD